MSGKASLILVLGFSLIFLIMGDFWNDLSTRATENHVYYFKSTNSHNIAVSGMNIALNKVHFNLAWNAGIKDLAIQNGIVNVTVTEPDTISKELISTGNFMGLERTVKVKLMKASYAKYAWFIASVSTGSGNKRTWITGDTVWGGFHSNQSLNIEGDPVFYGKVSVDGKVNMSPGSHPQFLGGLVTGVEVSWDKNMGFPSQTAAALEGQAQGGTCYFNSQNLWLRFNADGTVTYRTAATNVKDDIANYSAPITLPLATMAPTNIIYLDKGDIYISGTLNGEVTIVADQSSGSGGGNVYFVDDLVYETDPMLPDGMGGYIPNDACDDVMGIIATNNVNIASSVASGGYTPNIVNKDLRIDGAIFCRSGGFNLIDLTTTYKTTKTGTIYLRGSMTAGKEEMVAIYDKNKLIAGYNRHVVLDERFLVRPPLYFPYTKNYEVVSWLE